MINIFKVKNVKKNSGFIALMSAVIISVVLLLIVTNLSMTSFYNRFNILDTELKEKSVGIAEACIDKAILNLVKNSAYNPVDEVVSVGSDTCIIKSITTSGSIKTILVKADLKNYITNLQVKVDDTSFDVISWEEI